MLSPPSENRSVRYPVLTLTPAARPRRPFPWVTCLVLGVTLVLGLTLGERRVALGLMLTVGLKSIALISGCALAVWIEERLYTALSGRSWILRLLGASLVPAVAFVAALLAASTLYRATLRVGDGGTLSTTLALSCVWIASAGVGSLLIVILDLAISSLVQDLRRRITLAVLALVVLVTGFALALARVGLEWVQRTAEVASSTAREQFGIQLTPAQMSERLSSPETQRQFTLFLFTFAAIAGLPAVLSACSKLADTMMERLHPLARGFEAVAKGKLNVRVEVAGSSDFVALNRSFNQMVASLAEAQRMEHAFGQYVSPHVMELIRSQHGEASIPASLRTATVFFADIRGFTSLSEKLEPAQVLEVLNRYFDRAVPIVERYEGYLDKFAGDAMVVVFNGPIEQPDHCERAADCAIDLQKEIAAINQEGLFAEIGELAIGIGVATGPLVAGNLGSTRKMDYTVVGDTVNLAARLTGHASPGEVLVNQGTADALPQSVHRTSIGPLRVKGKEHPVPAFRIWPVTLPEQAS